MNPRLSQPHAPANDGYRTGHVVDLGTRAVHASAKETSAVTAIAVDVTAELGRLEAAHACDVSITTIKRRLKAGAFPHARQVGLDRSWVIPVQDLVDAGLLPASSLALPAIRSGADEPTRAPGGPSAARLAEAAAEIRGLRETLAQAKEEIAFLRGLLAEGRAA